MAPRRAVDASMAGRRIAVSYDLNGLMPLDPGVRRLATAAVERLASLGLRGARALLRRFGSDDDHLRHARLQHGGAPRGSLRSIRRPDARRVAQSGARRVGDVDANRDTGGTRPDGLLAPYPDVADGVTITSLRQPSARRRFVSTLLCRPRSGAGRLLVITTRSCRFTRSALQDCRRSWCRADSPRGVCRSGCKSSAGAIVTIRCWNCPPPMPRFRRSVSVAPRSICRHLCRFSPASRRPASGSGDTVG